MMGGYFPSHNAFALGVCYWQKGRWSSAPNTRLLSHSYSPKQPTSQLAPPTTHTPSQSPLCCTFIHPRPVKRRKFSFWKERKCKHLEVDPFTLWDCVEKVRQTYWVACITCASRGKAGLEGKGGAPLNISKPEREGICFHHIQTVYFWAEIRLLGCHLHKA